MRNKDRAALAGGYILACTHVSHLEPFIVGSLISRRIAWVSRIEFFKYWFFRWALYALDAFPVNRRGVNVRPIRTAIDRLRRDRLIGIFPEGGVAHGDQSAMRGGPIKLGACVMAQRAGVPIIPVILVGTEKLNAFWPWIPYRRVRLWVNFGEPIYPDLSERRRRVARLEMGRKLSCAFQALFREMRETSGLSDASIP